MYFSSGFKQSVRKEDSSCFVLFLFISKRYVGSSFSQNKVPLLCHDYVSPTDGPNKVVSQCEVCTLPSGDGDEVGVTYPLIDLC